MRTDVHAHMYMIDILTYGQDLLFNDCISLVNLCLIHSYQNRTATINMVNIWERTQNALTALQTISKDIMVLQSKITYVKDMAYHYVATLWYYAEFKQKCFKLAI